MRGPSSSHSAAALRIGRLLRELGSCRIKKVLVEYDPNGSLVTTHDGQGSDLGLCGGLMGWEADDERLKNYEQELALAGITCDIQYTSYNANHPNMYKLTAWTDSDSSISIREMVAISTGGGMIEVQEIDGFPVCLLGDYFDTLIYCQTHHEASTIRSKLETLQQDVSECGFVPSFIFLCDTDTTTYSNANHNFRALLQIRSSIQIPDNLKRSIEQDFGDKVIVHSLSPVLPIMARRDISVPFLNARSLEAFEAKYHDQTGEHLPLWKLALLYESSRGNLPEQKVMDMMLRVLKVMRAAVNEGVKGTYYHDRILPCQAPSLLRQLNEGSLLGGDVINKIILYVTAIMEVKSSMGVIVAAPTAGSCGACPGAILAVSDELALDEEETARALLVAGLMGVFIQERATFSAEVGGCMAETGAGAGMAAASIVSMCGGSMHQALGACSMAIQNSFGLVCDPVANRVEAPCLGKNVSAATNALTCANMAMANFTHLIPLDEVLAAMDAVGKQIPHELRCTGKGGLATTPTALKIERQLSGKGENAICSRGCSSKTPC